MILQKLKNLYHKYRGSDLKILVFPGTPDLLGYNDSGTFFTVELKVTKSNKIRFSPHQSAFHVKHPRNSFILVEALDPRSAKHVQYYLFPGSGIKALDAWGLKLEPLCLGLDAVWLVARGAWSLKLEACCLKLVPLQYRCVELILLWLAA